MVDTGDVAAGAELVGLRFAVPVSEVGDGEGLLRGLGGWCGGRGCGLGLIG